MFTRTNLVLLAIISVLCVFLVVQNNSLTEANKNNNDLSELIKYQDTRIDSFKNKLNQTISEKEVAEVNNEKIIKDLSQEVFNLKKKDENQIKQVNALIRLIQNAKLDTVFIPYDVVDTLPAKEDTSLIRKDSVVVPPKNFTYTTDSIKISGTTLLKGIRINSLYLPDTASFRIAEKKTSFFRPKETVIQSIHTNPLFRTNGIQAITLKHKTNAWNRWIKPLVVGIGASYITYRVVK